MGRLPAITLLLGLLLLTFATPAAPAPAQSVARHELGGVTVFTGSRSASIPVHVPQGATLDARRRLRRVAGPNPAVRIHGAGRFVGIVLVPDPHLPGSEPPWPIVIGQFRECRAKGCNSKRVLNVGPNFGQDEDKLPVPAGDYIAHLIADGKPVRVTIRFEGLSRRTVLRPREPSPVDLKTPPQALVSDGTNLWAAGSDYDAGSVGISMSATWVKLTEAARGWGMGLCQLQYPTAPPEEAYGPQCSVLDHALGSGFLWASALPIDDDEFIVLAYFGYHDQGSGPESVDGRFGYGAWFESRGVPIKRAGNTTFFVQTAETWD